MHVNLNASLTTELNQQLRSSDAPAPPNEMALLPDAYVSLRNVQTRKPTLLQPARSYQQLNQQATRLQQADSYLAEIETQLLCLRRSAGKEELVSRQQRIVKYIQQRQRLSAGAVDRQLAASLQQDAQVNFTLAGSERWLVNPQNETLVFRLGGEKRELSAVHLGEHDLPQQALWQLNVGLGQLGIYARAGNERDDLIFTAPERLWPRISQHLAVYGEGVRYPAGTFTPLTAQAESCCEEIVMQLSAGLSRSRRRHFQHSLDQIGQQRAKLRQQSERVGSYISDLASRLSPAQALTTAKAIGARFANATHDYALLANALSTQANLNTLAVNNLLAPA